MNQVVYFHSCCDNCIQCIFYFLIDNHSNVAEYAVCVVHCFCVTTGKAYDVEVALKPLYKFEYRHMFDLLMDVELYK